MKAWPFYIAAFIVITLAGVNNQLIKRVENEVLSVQRKQDRDEKLMTDALYQAVTRWDKLQEDNPELKVPKMPRPTATPEP